MKKAVTTLLIFAILISLFAPIAVIEAQAPTNGSTVVENVGGFLQGAWGIFNGGVNAFYATIVNALLSTFGTILHLSVVLYNASIDITIQRADTWLDNEAVRQAWLTLRDLANLAFIFILLFIGISTILRISSYGYRQLLARLIIVAILINFSFFITQAVIDVSNTLTIEILQDLNSGEEGLAGRLVTQTQVLRAFSLTSFESGDIILAGLFSTIFILITSFIFIAAAVLLISRLVILIFLLILSPLAFAAMILPSTVGRYGNKWWQELFSQSFYAPLYILFIVISLRIMESLGESVGIDGATFATAAVVNSTGFLEAWPIIAIYYAIATGFMIGSIIMAKQLGIRGSEQMIKLGRWLQGEITGVTGRNTIGQLARVVGRQYDSFASNVPEGVRKGINFATLGLVSDQNIRRAIKSVEDSKFGGKETYIEARDRTRKREQELGTVREEDKAIADIREDLAWLEENRPLEDLPDEEYKKEVARREELSEQERQILEEREGKTREERDIRSGQVAQNLGKVTDERLLDYEIKNRDLWKDERLRLAKYVGEAGLERIIGLSDMSVEEKEEFVKTRFSKLNRMRSRIDIARDKLDEALDVQEIEESRRTDDQKKLVGKIGSLTNQWVNLGRQLHDEYKKVNPGEVEILFAHHDEYRNSRAATEWMGFGQYNALRSGKALTAADKHRMKQRRRASIYDAIERAERAQNAGKAITKEQQDAIINAIHGPRDPKEVAYLSFSGILSHPLVAPHLSNGALREAEIKLDISEQEKLAYMIMKDAPLDELKSADAEVRKRALDKLTPAQGWLMSPEGRGFAVRKDYANPEE